MRRASAVIVGALAVASLIAAAPPSSPLPADDDRLAVANGYLDALYERRYDEIDDLAHPDLVLDDPTAAALGSAWHIEGRDEVVDFFRQSSNGIERVDREVVRQFTAGEHVVLELVYHVRGDGAVLGAPGQSVELSIPAVTVLQVREGKVLHHLDHVDYPTMQAQLESQTDSPIDP